MKKNIKQYKDKTSVTVGYSRVSLTDNQQELELSIQKEALSFCKKLYIEKDSGEKQATDQNGAITVVI